MRTQFTIFFLPKFQNIYPLANSFAGCHPTGPERAEFVHFRPSH